MIETTGQSELSQSDWMTFRDRVAEAAAIARSAMTNVVTALASVTVAIVGIAVTVATAELHSSPLATAMIFAIAGAGLSALAIVVALTIEAIRASNYASRWHELYVEFHDKALAGQPLPPLPRNELRFARMSVGVHWKVSLPVVLFLIGLGATAAALIFDGVKMAQ